MVNILSPEDIQIKVAQRVKSARLTANFTQQGLALRAGVSLGSLKRFEGEGEISLKNLIRLAFALRLEDEIGALFQPKPSASLDTLLDQSKISQRQRGRKS
ncbi:MAG: helix-turn-helix transcriptional regulator [Pseudodesulfovibrio sp.]|nr:helix-turn-helix transcriptional regulator [Pseudodesulfovibrio sp.]